jgi:hypothetical protein
MSGSPRAASEGLANGLSVPAGEVHVITLPDADRDIDPQRRPLLAVLAGAVRVVALGPGGRIDADTVLDASSTPPPVYTVPAGVRRIAVVGSASPWPQALPPRRRDGRSLLG